ncbi:MAG: nicotinamide mononucleotide transporter [Bacteroidales bacterium]|nr:nicotinamide mononucleotide transporter [Bacteroidales bacterium]
MSLQVYYLIISILGWYWWVKGSGRWAQGSERRAQGEEKLAQGSGLRAQGEEKLAEGSGLRAQGRRESDRSGENGGRGDKKQELQVTRLKLRTGIILSVIFVMLFVVMWFVLSRMTDSPVPGRDAFVTSLSIVATWMLARKIYEHWYLWIVVNAVATLLFLSRGLYPTVILYIVYGVMSFAGLKAWGKTIRGEMPHPPTPSPGGEGE